MANREFAEKTEFTDAEKLALIDATMADLDRGWFADPEPESDPRADCGTTEGSVSRWWSSLAGWVRSVSTRRES